MNAKPGPKENEKNLIRETKNTLRRENVIRQLLMKLVLTLSH